MAMRALAVAIVLTLVTVRADAQDRLPRAILASAPYVDRLPNGLTVVTIEGPANGVVAYYALVRVGSRDETEAGRTGYAHLFEHMMFRGTEARPGGEYDRAMQRLGADYNAYTTTDYTLYTIVVPSGRLRELVEIEAERFQHPVFSDEAFAIEAGTVFGELVSSAADPLERMYDALVDLAFDVHPYGHTVIGALPDICAMGRHAAEARRFFERFYTPDGLVLVVSGDVRHDVLLPAITAAYGGWQGARERGVIPAEPEQVAPRRRDLVHAGAAAPELLIAYRVPSFAGGAAASAAERRASIRTAAALEIARVLAFSDASPLHRTLVLESQTVVTLEAWANAFSRDPGLFVVHASTADDPDIEPTIAAITAELSAIGRGERDALIVRTKRNVRYGLSMALRAVDDQAELVASMFAVGDRASSYAEYIEALDTIEPSDVHEAVRRHLVESRRSIVTLRGDVEQTSASDRPVCPGTP